MEAISDSRRSQASSIAVIDERTTVSGLKNELRWNHAYYEQAQGCSRDGRPWRTAGAGFQGNRELVRAGLVVLTFGNVSGVDRSENVLAIKPSGVPYEELRPEAIVVVELETGQVVAGERPSSDTPTHAVLYRHFEALGGIAHTHSRFATAWAQAVASFPASAPPRRPLPRPGAGDPRAGADESTATTRSEPAT